MALARGANLFDHAPVADTADLPWRPEFLDALRMLARVSEALAQRDMIEQARALLPLVSKADRDYLERRIRTNTLGDYGVEDLGK